jgi:predicted GTPase
MLKFIRPIVLFLVDSVEDISHRDKTILHEIEHIALPIIFCLNKTDLLNNKESKIGVEKAKFHLNFAKHIPIIPISAKI